MISAFGIVHKAQQQAKALAAAQKLTGKLKPVSDKPPKRFAQGKR